MSKFIDCETCGVNYNADTFDEDNPHKCQMPDIKRHVEKLQHEITTTAEDEHDSPMCDRCGCFVPAQKLELPSSTISSPEHAADILCKDCVDYMENPPTGLEKPGLYY